MAERGSGAGDDDAEVRLRAATIGEVTVLDGPIHLAGHDSAWSRAFAAEADRVVGVLRERALLIEHVGSTAVPGLAAKPIIDMVLAVADSANEPAYVPDMESAGYVLRIREPDWYQHRLFRRTGAAINLHVFSRGCEEIDRMLRFRDHLRTDRTDRELYEQTKFALARRTWRYTQSYADAKTEVVEQILARALR